MQYCTKSTETMSDNLAVIMSVYAGDTADNVKSAVESILSQTYGDFTFYIQLDGPVSGQVECYFDGMTDSRVVVRKRDVNKGLARSLNELLEIVLPKGYEFIARMDADDMSDPKRFERQLLYMKSHTDIDCAGCWAVEITADGQEYFRKRMPESHGDCSRMFRKRDCIIHPTAMFRKEYFQKAGLYETDTFYGEDTMMWANGFASGCRLGNVPEFLYRFRIDAQFFDRRRGWSYAKGILELRHRVNRMLGYGFVGDCYALAYAAFKMLPVSVLKILYRKLR